ncbi:predicted protein [Histoplasma capsulatum G186AR]|uniref:Uncharacterized protein n=1 Tax=Ajellomyces capsulatus (strain G186AR / H82 / ATCC MYA-2454 / RMSCC 2432) TaxID=447093 RepID=C0NY38_AJECG|nr:uncharacterized protein HCBG_07832 [Histoplasma capsulatum G186AR]EEH03706.1 predicted protein [Histoplasma capsulatum G186AR]
MVCRQWQSSSVLALTGLHLAWNELPPSVFLHCATPRPEFAVGIPHGKNERGLAGRALMGKVAFLLSWNTSSAGVLTLDCDPWNTSEQEGRVPLWGESSGGATGFYREAGAVGGIWVVLGWAGRKKRKGFELGPDPWEQTRIDIVLLVRGRTPREEEEEGDEEDVTIMTSEVMKP